MVAGVAAAGVLRIDEEVAKAGVVTSGVDVAFPRRLKALDPPKTFVLLDGVALLASSDAFVGALNKSPPPKELLLPNEGVAEDLLPNEGVTEDLLPNEGVTADLIPKEAVLLVASSPSIGMEGRGNFSVPLPKVGGLTPLEDGDGGRRFSRNAPPFDAASCFSLSSPVSSIVVAI